MKIPTISNLGPKTPLDAKINEVKGKKPSITNLATKTALNAVENKKIPSVSNLVQKKLTITQKFINLKIKLLTMIMIDILLLQSLIGYYQKILL